VSGHGFSSALKRFIFTCLRDFSPRGTDKLDLFRSRFTWRHFFREGESPSAKLLAIFCAAIVTNN
jgi:hypothetical protein